MLTAEYAAPGPTTDPRDCTHAMSWSVDRRLSEVVNSVHLLEAYTCLRHIDGRGEDSATFELTFDGVLEVWHAD